MSFEDGRLCCAYVQNDPVTEEQEFSLFTEDGRGNGDLIFSLPLGKLRAIIEEQMGAECTALPPLCKFRRGEFVEIAQGSRWPLDSETEWRDAHILEFAPEFGMPFYRAEYLDGTRPERAISGTMMRRATYDEA